MCGHGIIAVITMVLETGNYEMDGERKFIIDSLAGEVIAYAECEGQKVQEVWFENVPSFVYKKDFPIKIDGQAFEVDIAFGGAFYAILDSVKLNLHVNNESMPNLQDWGMKIKHFIEGNLDVKHPLQNDLKDICGVIFSDEPSTADADLKNVTIFADRQIDRSPCGTGTSAHVAALYERGELNKGETFSHESITNGVFHAEVIANTKVEAYDAIVSKIAGTARITGFHQFVVDNQDEMPEGFLL